MSFINKLGFEKIEKYQELQDDNNRKHARILQLETQIIQMEESMKSMSYESQLQNQLDYMNARYEKIDKAFTRNSK